MNRFYLGILLVGLCLGFIANSIGVLPVQGFFPRFDDNQSEEFESVKLLAESGDPESQNKLGWFYDQGRGVPENPKKAAEWYLKSARQGWREAQINIGVMYELGRGVDQDLIESEKWYSYSDN